MVVFHPRFYKKSFFSSVFTAPLPLPFLLWRLFLFKIRHLPLILGYPSFFFVFFFSRWSDLHLPPPFSAPRPRSGGGAPACRRFSGHARARLLWPANSRLVRRPSRARCLHKRSTIFAVCAVPHWLSCHTQFYKENRIHLICALGSSLHTYDRHRVNVSKDNARKVRE